MTVQNQINCYSGVLGILKITPNSDEWLEIYDCLLMFSESILINVTKEME